MNYFIIDHDDGFSIPGCRVRRGCVFEFDEDSPARVVDGPCPNEPSVEWAACYDEAESSGVGGYLPAYRGRVWASDLEAAANSIHSFAFRDVGASHVFFCQDGTWIQVV